MTTLALVGATGRLGGHVLREALGRGWHVRALVRDAGRLPAGLEAAVEPVGGSVRDPVAVAALVVGCSGLVSCLGARRGQEDYATLPEGMAAIVEAARAAALRHLVVVASAGLLDAPGGGLRRDAPGYPAAFRTGSAAHLEAWRILQASGLSHTLVCPPELVEGERSQLLCVSRDLLPEGPRRVSMPALAAWMLDEWAAPAHAGCRVGLINDGSHG